jgi:uncharacterized protein (DUF1330 family)
MSACWTAHVTVMDAESYSGYSQLSPGAIAEFGAKFLARGGEANVLEGEDFQRHVAIEFPDIEAAIACYAPPE